DDRGDEGQGRPGPVSRPGAVPRGDEERLEGFCAQGVGSGRVRAGPGDEVAAPTEELRVAVRTIDVHAHVLFPKVMGKCSAAGPEMGLSNGVQFFRSGNYVL